MIEHLKRVESVGPEKFMKSYYVGYGHKSIGDCGTTTIFVENVSMLAAKAIQDTQLYANFCLRNCITNSFLQGTMDKKLQQDIWILQHSQLFW